MPEPINPYVRTYTGRSVDLLDPQPDQICIEDIAHHLSMLCRFSGACRRFYSVAEHSYRMARAAGGNRQLALACLLHDAHEAYTGDISSPTKRALGLGPTVPFQRAIQTTIERALTNYRPTLGILQQVDQFDLYALKLEAEELMAGPLWSAIETIQVPDDFRRRFSERPAWASGWKSLLAKSNFLSAFQLLTATFTSEPWAEAPGQQLRPAP